MKRDWHVSYHRSTYQGRPCFYFVWSHIEHIFVEINLPEQSFVLTHDDATEECSP